MKKLISVLLMISFQNLNSQFVQTPMTVHTPYGNVNSYTYSYMPSHYSGGGQSNPRFDFKVTLSNDSMLSLKSKILSDKGKMYITKKNKGLKQNIFPADTKELIGTSRQWGTVKGFPADSCWLFKVTYGAINCYASIPAFDINYAIAIQSGDDGKIVPLTKGNIEKIVGTEDEKTNKLLKKGYLVDAIQRYNDQQRK